MKDPRRIVKGNLRHPLVEIIFLVISAVISGADDWENISQFGKDQLSWLRKFYPFKYGVASHDTLGRVFAAMDHEEFNSCFTQWVENIRVEMKGEVVAIDGKRICGSFDTTNAKAAIHMVSAYAAGNNLCLGQQSCGTKSNEITAIPALLEVLALKGCCVTIDAMGCQHKIATSIIAKEADYILAVKQNQGGLHQQVEKIISITEPASVHSDTDAGHGRIETRKCSIYSNLKFLDDKEKWTGLNCIVKIESERISKIDGATQRETRYYISSLTESAEQINQKVRSHWAIENKLHWVLDVVFDEDMARRRKDNSAKNFNIILKTALTLISRENTLKMSKRKKRHSAAWSPDFREKILAS